MSMTDTIPTLAQYHESETRRTAEEYGLSLVEVRAAYPRKSYTLEYAQECERMITASIVPSYRVWTTWGDEFRTAIFRNHTVRTNETVGAVLVGYDVRESVHFDTEA